MIKYEILNHKHEWVGNAYLSDMPSNGYMPTIKNVNRAVKIFKDQEKEVEAILKKWKLEFEKIGESEERPSAKPKAKPRAKRKKGK